MVEEKDRVGLGEAGHSSLVQMNVEAHDWQVKSPHAFAPGHQPQFQKFTQLPHEPAPSTAQSVEYCHVGDRPFSDL